MAVVDPKFREWIAEFKKANPNVADARPILDTAQYAFAAGRAAQREHDAALRAAPEWQPIETAPEGRLVVVGWMDTEDSHYPENYEFDYLEGGLWAKHEDCVEHAHAVAPPGSQMPKEQPPYQWWMDLPAFPAARPQGVKDV